MKNHYNTLGIERTASADEIKRAYRRLASQHHPDKGGDKNRFQEVEEAYRILSDPNRRQQYDNPSAFGSFDSNPGFQSATFNFDSIFNMFGAQFHPHMQRQQQAQMSLWVTLADVAQGGPRTISVGTAQGTMAVEIEIPQGISDGDRVQYARIGPGGMDLIITFRIHNHPRYQRQGQNLICDETVNIWDLISGCNLTVKDVLNNQLQVTIPPRTQPGTMIRLKGRGLVSKQHPPGDLLVRVQGRIPDQIDAELLAQIEQARTK
jgi:DnaJ-class molecular chaperone